MPVSPNPGVESGPHGLANRITCILRTMRKGAFFAAACAAVFVVSSANAQAVEQISFEEVIQIALQRSSALRSSANQLELEAASVRAEKGDFLPNLNLNATPSVNFGFSFDQTSLQLVNETTWFANYGLSSSLNIFRGFGDVASLKQARLSYEAADYSHDRATEDVIQLAILNYLQVIQDKEQVKIDQENVVYQGHAGGLEPDTVWEVGLIATGGTSTRKG